MKIKYAFANETVTIEVEDQWATVLVDLDRQEYNIDQKETRRHCSLEAYSSAVILLIVAAIMLLGNTHTFPALNTPGDGRCHFTGNKGIFRVVFKIPSAQRIPMDVEARRQPDGNTNLQHLFTHGSAHFFQKFRIPGLSQYRFTGPCGHVAVNSFPLAGTAFQERLHFRQPAPPPVSRKSLSLTTTTREIQ